MNLKLKLNLYKLEDEQAKLEALFRKYYTSLDKPVLTQSSFQEKKKS